MKNLEVHRLSLVCHFCPSSKSLKKIEKIQGRALRILYNDSTRYYNQLEIFKTFNHLNVEHVRELFHKTTILTHRPLDVKVNQNSITKYSNKSLRSLRPHIWNSLPRQIREETDYNKFKNYIYKCFGVKCKCNLSFYLNQRYEIINSATSDLIPSVQKQFYILYFVLFCKFVNF